MFEVYTGRRGSAVTVADPSIAASRYQRDLMEGATGWFRVCYADGAITLAPTGLAPLTFETEGHVVLEAEEPTGEGQGKLDSEFLLRKREFIEDFDFVS
jgi:hypothetical protein